MSANKYASFSVATVASAWNYWYLSAISNGTLGVFPKRSESKISKRAAYFPVGEIDEVDDVFKKFFNLSVDAISNPSIPNPFGSIAGVDNITLADGTEGDQCLPVWSLIQPSRKVDFM